MSVQSNYQEVAFSLHSSVYAPLHYERYIYTVATTVSDSSSMASGCVGSHVTIR